MEKFFPHLLCYIFIFTISCNFLCKLVIVNISGGQWTYPSKTFCILTKTVNWHFTVKMNPTKILFLKLLKIGPRTSDEDDSVSKPYLEISVEKLWMNVLVKIFDTKEKKLGHFCFSSSTFVGKLEKKRIKTKTDIRKKSGATLLFRWHRQEWPPPFSQPW